MLHVPALGPSSGTPLEKYIKGKEMTQKGAFALKISIGRMWLFEQNCNLGLYGNKQLTYNVL